MRSCTGFHISARVVIFHTGIFLSTGHVVGIWSSKGIICEQELKNCISLYCDIISNMVVLVYVPGANMDLRDTEEKTALQYAEYMGHIQVVRLLQDADTQRSTNLMLDL